MNIIYPVENTRITNHNHPILRPGNSHIEPSGIIQEADARHLVRPHTGNNNIILLPALIPIHRRNLNLLIEIGVLRQQLPIFLQIIDNISSLPFIRRDNAHLICCDTGLLEMEHDFLDSCGLCAVEVGGSGGRDLFAAVEIQEE
jgi:hypothetical protein